MSIPFLVFEDSQCAGQVLTMPPFDPEVQAGARLKLLVGSFPLTVSVTTMGYRSCNKAPLRTVTGRGNDPSFRASDRVSCSRLGFGAHLAPGS